MHTTGAAPCGLPLAPAILFTVDSLFSSQRLRPKRTQTQISTCGCGSGSGGVDLPKRLRHFVERPGSVEPETKEPLRLFKVDFGNDMACAVRIL